MKAKWSALKKIISESEQGRELLLSLINEDGKIISANANMVRTLHLENLKTKGVNFFDFLHPVNVKDFKSAIKEAADNCTTSSMELYLKNGYYHPTKWQISSTIDEEGCNMFLCVGHKILDDKRLSQYNKLGEKNYQLIVEGLSAGILFQDTNGELIAVNQRAAEIFSTTLERLYQLSDIESLWNLAWQISNESNNPVLFADTPFMRALKTGQTQAEVLIVRLRNGETRWLHFSSQPLFDEVTLNVFSVVTNIIDITKERLLSSQLKERDALFKAFMKQTPNLAWVVDEDEHLVFASHTFLQYFRLEEADALNKKITELVPGSIAANMYAKHVEVLRTGKPAEHIERAELADGTNLVFHISLFEIDSASGKRLLGGYAINLTDKYEIEKRLRQSNDRLLLLTRATSDAIWEWDMQTGQIFRNDALMDMIGYNMDAPKGLSWWLRRIHPDDRNRVSDKVKESTDNKEQSWEEEYLFKCADGTYKHMRDKGYIVYENGLPVKMIGSLHDVTNLKQLEGELMTEKLERQKEISETIIRAQEKERTRIGHELHDNVNQILSTAKLFVDMMKPIGKEEKATKKKTVDYILLALEEIRKLSKELVLPQLTGKSLVESIQTLIDDIHLATDIKIKFVFDYENEMLSQGKKVTLLRIVQEQLKNILKHSKAKRVDIVLQNRDGDTHIIIKDDGIGFCPKQTHRGIGLSNIYERVNFYNGETDVQTEPGKGCTLFVAIPSL